MNAREVQCLLITGWARPEGPGWWLLDPDGTGANWIEATPDEVTALEAALATLPTIATIHQGLMDTAKGHRADCATLRPNPCTCPHVEPHRIESA